MSTAQEDGIKETVYTSPVAQDGVIYIAGGKEGTVLAIRAGGKGDVTICGMSAFAVYWG